MALRSRKRARSYELGARLAAGGMGEVYEAFTADLNRTVAVKRMLDADATREDLKFMFLREVAVAATLEHPNVVEVLDAGQNGIELFLVMELVDGPSLSEIIEVLRRQNKILPVEISCHIVSCVATGLAHAHERTLPDGTPLGIVHRDVAPENVLIGTDGIPKVVDFGLAKLSGHSMTQPGVVRGRPRSLSPEQARGEGVDARSDIFSLGAMLFELTGGHSLYHQEALGTLLYKVAQGQYDPIEPRLTHIDADLTKIISKCIAVDPKRRYQSVRQLKRALDGFRAARGMRVSSRAVAQVVTMTWPAIVEMRQRHLENSMGELEGRQLDLPADKSEMGTGDLITDPSGGMEVPASLVKSEPSGDVRVERSKLAAGLNSSVPASSVAPAAFTSALPRPSRSLFKKNTMSGDIEQQGWRFYVAAVFVACFATFALVWWAAHQEVASQATIDPPPMELPGDQGMVEDS